MVGGKGWGLEGEVRVDRFPNPLPKTLPREEGQCMLRMDTFDFQDWRMCWKLRLI